MCCFNVAKGGGEGKGERSGSKVTYRNTCTRISHKWLRQYGAMEGRYGREQLARRHERERGEIQSTMNSVISHASVY